MGEIVWKEFVEKLNAEGLSPDAFKSEDELEDAIKELMPTANGMAKARIRTQWRSLNTPTQSQSQSPSSTPPPTATVAVTSEPKNGSPEEILAAAERGDAHAQEQVGLRYYGHGNAAPKDLIEAAKWFRKAAEQGSASAQCILGACYSEGHGVRQSDAEAFRWYRMAAEKGHTAAQLNLAICFEEGKGVVANQAEADRWFRASSRGKLHPDFPTAMF